MMIANPDPTEYRDIHGRQIHVGDLLRAPHFTAARRRKVWLYYVVAWSDKWGAVRAFTPDRQDCFNMSVIADCAPEIIDGRSIYVRKDGETSKFVRLICWWERPKVKQEAKS